MKSFGDLHRNLTLREINGTLDDEHHKSMAYNELISVLYVIGIIGSFSALLHLYRKRSFKNTKQAFMLK